LAQQAALPVRLQLQKGLYRVEGPARLRIAEGTLYALGRLHSSGEELKVPRGIVVCLEVDEQCVVEVYGGNLEEAKAEEEVIGVWRRLADEVATRGRIVVIGEIDSGKTTFSTFLLNTALSKGLSVALIDADVGQNDVGCPGTLALAMPDRPISWPSELRPQALYFVGSNTPMGCEDAIILGLAKLLRKASDRDVVVVNTDGWVGDKRALAYKCRVVEAVEPDTLVVMEGSGAAEPIARIFEGTRIRVVRAPTPPAARGKERELRKIRRELSYLSLLKESTVKSLRLDRIRFWASLTFAGRRDEKLSAALSALLGFDVLAEVCGNYVILLATGEREYKRLLELREQLAKLLNKEVMISYPQGLKGFLAGLANEALEHIGVGVVEDIDLREGVVKVRTPNDVEGVRLIIVGKLQLSEEGGERARGPPPVM